MSNFSIDGDMGTLQPYNRGLHSRIPAWVALFIAIPLILASLFAASVPNTGPWQFIFGIPGGLFFILWVSGRGTSKQYGIIDINKRTVEATLVDRTGCKRTVEFGDFLSIQIERLVTRQGYLWRGVLSGREGNLVLISGVFSQRGVVNWLTPVASWLAIPMKVSETAIDGIKWALMPDREINPYP